MIAIPNMELPPWCGKCIFQDGEICYAINENDIGSGLSFFDLEDLRNFCIKRRDVCPLIDIVTCGECKWCDDKGNGRALICTNPYIDMDIHPLDFCSYGEPRGSEYVAKD